MPRVLGKSCVSAHKLLVNTPPMLAAVAQKHPDAALHPTTHTLQSQVLRGTAGRIVECFHIHGYYSHPLSTPCVTPTTCNPTQSRSTHSPTPTTSHSCWTHLTLHRVQKHRGNKPAHAYTYAPMLTPCTPQLCTGNLGVVVSQHGTSSESCINSTQPTLPL